ncbi:hypothetical protein ACF1BB_30630 [Streptomyces griseoluteus]
MLGLAVIAAVEAAVGEPGHGSLEPGTEAITQDLIDDIHTGRGDLGEATA